VQVKFKKLPSGLYYAVEGKEWAEAHAIGSTFEFEPEVPERLRTDQQRKALEVFCADLAEIMNAHGIGMKATMKAKSLDVSMTQATVKAVIFKPILEAMAGKDSTTKANTVELSAVHQMLCRTLPEAFKDYPGFVVPEWPTRFNQ